MKILRIIPYFYPAWAYGGPVRVAYELSRALSRRGHETTVYTTDTLDRNSRLKARDKVSELDGIRIHYFRNLSNWLAGRHYLFVAPSYVEAVRRNLRDFDIVHLHGARTLLNLPAYYYAHRYGVAYVIHAHGGLPRIMSKRRLKRLYDVLGGYKLLRNASKVIAETKMEAEQYAQMGVNEDKIDIVPNGIDLSQYEDLPPSGEFKRKYSLQENERMILFVGRIHRIKGLELLARAYARLLRELDRVQLVIVGLDDGYLPQLERLIEKLGIGKKVILTGPLYGKDKLGAYVDADLYVLPSTSEGAPISVFESCACGTPVIITDGCGIRDVIDGQAGIVVPYDEDQLSNAMVRILTDDKIRQEFGDKGRILVREQFNWPTIAKQVEQVYLSCLPHSKSS